MLSCVLEPPGEARLPVAGHPVPVHRLLAAEGGEGAAHAPPGGHLHQGGHRLRDGAQAGTAATVAIYSVDIILD